MRFFAIPILILLVVIQSYSDWIVIAVFNNNRDYIEQNLCENRYRPQLQCKGKCLLMKKLQQKEKEQEQPVLKLQVVSVVLFSGTCFATSIATMPAYVNHFLTDNRAAKLSDRPGSVFQPPRS